MESKRFTKIILKSIEKYIQKPHRLYFTAELNRNRLQTLRYDSRRPTCESETKFIVRSFTVRCAVGWRSFCCQSQISLYPKSQYTITALQFDRITLVHHTQRSHLKSR